MVASGSIYNSRNYSILLNEHVDVLEVPIYNSRNYSILLNEWVKTDSIDIYNSRNYSILLNIDFNNWNYDLSTTVEIILYYLTQEKLFRA